MEFDRLVSCCYYNNLFTPFPTLYYVNTFDCHRSKVLIKYYSKYMSIRNSVNCNVVFVLNVN